VLGGERHDQRRDRLGELVRERGRVGDEHFGDAAEFSCLSCRGRTVLSCDEDVDVAPKGTRRGKCARRRILERCIVVVGEQKRGHMTPASLSLPTSSLTLPTLTPLRREAGSAVLSTFSLGARSKPSAAASRSSIGFFRAFMMLGSDA